MRGLRLLPFLFSLLVGATLLAQERQLYWDTLAVTAHLDADGRLQVEERQVMVFTGDWNGGERKFNIRPRQQFSFEGMSRVDANGSEVPMEEGSLDNLNQYAFPEKNVLRWRARMPDDPPFDKTPVTYVLRYALSNILVRNDDEYVLDHDFAFAERAGTIQHFRLDLTLDPAWQTNGALQKSWTVDEIPPGESFVLRVPLRYHGAGVPTASDGPGRELRMMLIALGAIPLLLLGYALLREKRLGRLERVAPDQVDRTWIERNLLRERAEVIGAMWDSTVGAPEVSATLARMVAEGRLKSSVSGDNLELEILTRKDLNEYEQALLDGLFFRGNTTSTSAIQTHYADSGFDPAKTMSAPLMKYVQEQLPKGEPVKPSSAVSWLLFLAAIAAFGYAILRDREFLVPAIVILVGGMILSLFSMIAPSFWRTRKHLGVASALLAMLPAAIIVAAVGFVIWRAASIGSPDLSMEAQGAMAVLAIWLFSVAVSALRSTESREAIAFLKMLGAARDYFRRELRKQHPALDDAWYPYALAFGLDDDVQKWFRSFPGASTSSAQDTFTASTSSGSSSSTFSPSSWSGGGGSFGGAGASGMWALAASGMAAGVAAPSSSSDGGSSSSSSSGGSSGGGGGGGW